MCEIDGKLFIFEIDMENIGEFNALKLESQRKELETEESIINFLRVNEPIYDNLVRLDVTKEINKEISQFLKDVNPKGLPIEIITWGELYDREVSNSQNRE